MLRVGDLDKSIDFYVNRLGMSLLRKKDYWNVGGCEEDLVGNYGQTDPIFWYRAKGKLKITSFIIPHKNTNPYPKIDGSLKIQ